MSLAVCCSSSLLFANSRPPGIHPLSLHDALPIFDKAGADPERVKRELADLNLVPEDWGGQTVMVPVSARKKEGLDTLDRKSTRLNSSHANISYAVFCLKKKKKKTHNEQYKLTYNT